jgi:hypothetical protein
VAGAAALQEAIEVNFLPKLPKVTMADVSNNPDTLIASAVVIRQIGGLRSAVALARTSLGHLALPLVRPACEERIWIDYLFSLELATRRRLLLLLASLEGSKTVHAQQQFLGSKEMKRLGFGKRFVNEQQRNRAAIEADLIALGQTLGWPDGAVSPPTGWVASKAGLSRLYDFLYSASSKGVHFSPSEYMRSGWSGGLSGDSPVTLLAPPYAKYRTAFSLHWLSLMLVETLGGLVEHGPLAEVELDDNAGAAIGHAARQVGQFGRLPIVLASEFNLE